MQQTRIERPDTGNPEEKQTSNIVETSVTRRKTLLNKFRNFKTVPHC
jgi:hypothetical protein